MCLLEYLTVYAIGALGYGLMELAWRGATHWTMLLAGGLCLALIHTINIKLARLTLFSRCLLGSLAVTSVELAFGVVVNLWLGWNVWSYSMYPLNLLGQVCLLYSYLWLVLCIPLSPLCAALHRLLSGARGRTDGTLPAA